MLLLHRRGVNGDRPTLLRELFGLAPDDERADRVRFLVGDVTAANLGMPDAPYQDLARTVTHFLHAAASTRFDLPLAEARRVNVGGTARVIDLARRCDHLERFGFVSTAYVAGRRTGIITERERRHDAGFVNTYEQSKYEAEALLDAAWATLPIAVYRPSTVLGDSRTGRVGHFTAPHHALRVMHLGLAGMLPGDPADRVDLVPADHVAETLARLFIDGFAPGQVFHLTAPVAKSYTLAEIVAESDRFLAELDRAWARRRYPTPVFASADAFELFARSAEEADNPLLHGVLGALRRFVGQLAHPKRFDRTTLRHAIPDYDDRLPDVRTYYRAVVAYCLRTGWGRHA